MDLSKLHLVVTLEPSSIGDGSTTGEARPLAGSFLSGIDYPFLSVIVRPENGSAAANPPKR